MEDYEIPLPFPERKTLCIPYPSTHFHRHQSDIFEIMLSWFHDDSADPERSSEVVQKRNESLKKLVDGLEGFRFAKPDPENDAVGGNCTYVVGVGIITKS